MTMQSFIYDVGAARVLFGPGRMAELPGEVERLGARRALVVTTPPQRQTGEGLMSMLGALGAAMFDGAVMHTPTEVTETAMASVRSSRIDCLVSIGGGSTIGLAKALSWRTGLPHVAIPTTYAGSEVTPILGETSKGVKTTQRSAALLPAVVIYDVNQTLSLPAAMSASSGLNAMAHAAEALYARDANPITSLMAEECIASLARSLPIIVRHPGDVDARGDAQLGAWLGGTCLGAVGMALHHKLCHVLGGTFDLPHAETHAAVLPHAMAYNAGVAPDAMRRLGRALGGDGTPWAQLHELTAQLGLPTSLRAIGMPADGLERALELVLGDSYWNPRPMAAEPLRRLLANAWSGAAPQPD